MARGTMRVTLTGSDEESQPGCAVTPSVLALRKLNYLGRFRRASQAGAYNSALRHRPT